MNSRIPSKRASGTSASKLTLGMGAPRGPVAPGWGNGNRGVASSADSALFSDSESFKGAGQHYKPVRHRETGFVKALGSGERWVSWQSRRVVNTGFVAVPGSRLCLVGGQGWDCQAMGCCSAGFHRGEALGGERRQQVGKTRAGSVGNAPSMGKKSTHRNVLTNHSTEGDLN